MDTIFALSSGAPPAGIAVIRITGPRVRAALEEIVGRLPQPRVAETARITSSSGELLDRGLVLFFPGPSSVTGEDVGELHCHGGRAVVAAVERALAGIAGCRRAQPGEFTRRAFANGRIDLAEAEGLADLLAAESEIQRRSAMAMASGALSRRVEGFRERLLGLSARVEAVLDFEDESDVAELTGDFRPDLFALEQDVLGTLDAPHAEILREGFRVALAGPPNAGKSTLFNALTDTEAAITADIPGTTRDVLVQPVAMEGVPFTFVDMAGLRAPGDDRIETIGIARAAQEIARADLVLWLGPEEERPDGAWNVQAQIDREDCLTKDAADFRISALTGEGIRELRAGLLDRARRAMPGPGLAALNARQRQRLSEASDALGEAAGMIDPLLLAEELRRARTAFDALVGRTCTEDVLDSLFGRFCIGK